MYENRIASQSFSWGHGMMNANPNHKKGSLVSKEFCSSLYSLGVYASTV